MAKLAKVYVALPRFRKFARLHHIHRLGDDEAIGQEFGAVCRAIFHRRRPVAGGPCPARQLTQECALKFAAEHGYDREDSSTTAASPIGWASPG
jgi:hypothetical protein